MGHLSVPAAGTCKGQKRAKAAIARGLTALYPPRAGGQIVDAKLSFKEMCTKFDVTPRTLRYYEYIELLAPQKDGRARWYGPREVARMTLILRGRRFGFSLEEIRQWLEIYDKRGTDAQMQEWVRLADRQLAALEEERARLDDTILDLRALRDEVAGSL
jgi:DNA-binding transcriptional MerR regulator